MDELYELRYLKVGNRVDQLIHLAISYIEIKNNCVIRKFGSNRHVYEEGISIQNRHLSIITQRSALSVLTRYYVLAYCPGLTCV